MTARCRVLTVGFSGNDAGLDFSGMFLGSPQSITARTVRSCLEVVAKAIRRLESVEPR